MSDVTFTAREVLELKALVIDVESNPFASRELRAIGGVRRVLSDSTLTKLGFELGPAAADKPSPNVT